MTGMTRGIAVPGMRAIRARLAHLARRKRGRNSSQLVVLTRSPHAVTALLIAAFHADCILRLAPSARAAIALLRKGRTAAVFFDWDSRESGWRDLCGACVECGVPFHLAAETPSDALFLAVACAGGASVLWKPLRARQVIAAMESTRAITAGSREDAQCHA